MSQTAIPYLFFRGGSSRGPFFNRRDLPEDLETLSAVLVSVVGSGHPLNIDGIGGGNAVTTKVAMLSPSDDTWADVDYFFAQVSVEDGLVDYKPTCGNMMTAVGPAAIEMGLIQAQDGVTVVKIRAVNTDAKVIARVQTPGRQVCYEGDTRIDGVPGTSAPVGLDFMEVVGSATGLLLPTGHSRDTINGIEVTCMDLAMPMVIARAADFSLSGCESREELDANSHFFERMEAIRLAAGKLMGMGDCSKSVTPKFALIAPAKHGGSLSVRYFMPWTTHPTLAVTGSQCLSACALTPGTVADGMLAKAPAETYESPACLHLEHPMGTMDVVMAFTTNGSEIEHQSAGLVRTARKLACGEVYVPAAVWQA